MTNIELLNLILSKIENVRNEINDLTTDAPKIHRPSHRTLPRRQGILSRPLEKGTPRPYD
jgi:hypothetical protein